MQATSSPPANPYAQQLATVRPVRPIEEIRRANLLTLVREAGNQAKLSLLTGVAPPIISQLARGVPHSTSGKPREMGSDIARRLEAGMGKPTGWMDVDHEALPVDSGINGREGQLVGLFRLLNDSEQSDIINALTRRLRQPPPGVPMPGPADKTAPKKH